MKKNYEFIALIPEKVTYFVHLNDVTEADPKKRGRGYAGLQQFERAVHFCGVNRVTRGSVDLSRGRLLAE